MIDIATSHNGGTALSFATFKSWVGARRFSSMCVRATLVLSASVVPRGNRARCSVNRHQCFRGHMRACAHVHYCAYGREAWHAVANEYLALLLVQWQAQCATAAAAAKWACSAGRQVMWRQPPPSFPRVTGPVAPGRALGSSSVTVLRNKCAYGPAYAANRCPGSALSVNWNSPISAEAGAVTVRSSHRCLRLVLIELCCDSS